MSKIPPIHAMRVTFVLEDSAFSWSETYWNSTAEFGTAQTLADSMFVARDKLMASTPTLIGYRLSLDDVFRDSLFSVRSEIFKRTRATPVNILKGAAERPYSVINTRWESGTLYRRMTAWGGVPEEVILDPVGPVFGPEYQRAFDAWKKILEDSNNTWGFKCRLKGLADGAPELAIKSLSYDAVTKLLTVTTFEDLSIVTGQRIVTRAIKYGKALGPPTPRPNGIFFLQAQTGAPTFTYTFGPFENLYQLSGGFISKGLWNFKQITNVKPVGETHRKRGVRSFRPLGRRPTRV